MDFIELLKAIIIGIVQGITEWLPVSSTGHMILLNEFIHLDVSTEFLKMFLVVIQLGSILAVIYLYFNKLNPFDKNKTKLQRMDTFSLWFKVIVACLPAAVIGLMFDDIIQDTFYNYLTVALMLILYGVLFIIVERVKKSSKIDKLNKLTYTKALLIGLFQVLALIPGTSRSGATIIGAIILGASRYVAAEFSFFLAIPVMFGASGYKLLKYFINEGFNFTPNEFTILVVGMLVAFFVSIVAIKFLMNYIKRHDFTAFGYYRIILGILIILYFYFVNN